MHTRWLTRAGRVSLFVLAAGAASVVPSSPSADAAVLTECHDAALARQRTEIDADMTIPQFDPALGTLLEVSVPTQGVALDTDARFENTAASAVTFKEDMTYQVTFTSPGGLASPPVVSGTVARIPTQTLAAFDGTLDFLGASAVTQPSISQAAAAAPVGSTAPGVLAAFTGTGTIPFHVTSSIGEVFTGGGGNVQFEINTFAAATVRVCYRYEQVVPTTTTPPTTAPPTTAPPTTTPPTTQPPVVVGDTPPVVRPPKPVRVRAAFTG